MNRRFSKLLLIGLVFFVGILSSCSQESDILATSKIKNITRGEFYSWLDTQKIPKEPLFKSEEKQKQALTDMALQLFVADKAKSEGFGTNRKTSVLMERARESTLYKYFSEAIMDKATLNEPSIRGRHIFLFLNRYKQDPDNMNKKIRLTADEADIRLNELMQKASDLIQRLDNGESFEKLADEFSEDTTKKNGGDFGNIIYGMMPADYSDPAFSLKKGEYTKTPVKTRSGVYIIKVEDKVVLTKKNIDSAIEDKNQKNNIKAMLYKKNLSEYFEKLKKADDVEFLYKKGRHHKDSDIIFRVGDKRYTSADIDKIIENRAIDEELDSAYENGIVSDAIKFNFAENYYSYLLWSRDAIRLGIDKNPEYLTELEQKEAALIFPEYIDATISKKQISISDQEVMEEYEQGKESKYSETVMENGAPVKRAKAFGDVKDEIYGELYKKAAFQKGSNWRGGIIKEYDLKINETELNGN